MEELSIYNCKFIYVKGEDNTLVDMLSRYPSTFTTCNEIAQHGAQHPHIEFNKTKIITLNHTKTDTTPLTAIASLVTVSINHPKTKISLSYDEETLLTLRESYQN